jgi:serine/threonine protein kinase
MDDEHWSLVSDEAKDLIQKLLRLESTDRISLNDVMQHPWLKVSFSYLIFFKNNLPSKA